MTHPTEKLGPFGYPAPPRRPERDPGDYYDNKRRAAVHWREHLREARLRGAPADELRWLEDRLEAARYVGD